MNNGEWIFALMLLAAVAGCHKSGGGGSENAAANAAAPAENAAASAENAAQSAQNAAATAENAPATTAGAAAAENAAAKAENAAATAENQAATAENAAAGAAAENAAAAGGASTASAANGQQVFQSTCSACHGTGVMGAPKYGDKAAWAPRIAQGKATLYQHAINGIRQMPAKGGNPSLTDDQVKAAVDYMVAAASK